MSDIAQWPATATESDWRWHAVITRDGGCDGKFYYSVATTGIYCRPTCAARRPRLGNVRFHRTREDAERAGFRPCRRCKPEQASLRERQAATVAEACRRIETAEEFPSLDELADAAGLSPHHFHRLFKSVTGTTPKAYASAHRAHRLREALARGEASVTDAIYEAGFNSSGRFYEFADHMLGMTPSAYRAGGANAEVRFAVAECSLGTILVARSTRGVCAILLGDDPDALVRDLRARFPHARLSGEEPAFAELVARVVAHVEMPSTSLDLPLDIRGTCFQQRVWQALRQIPVGTTATYGEIARRIGAPKAARAVAQACAANLLAVAVPCHRVVCSDGGLSGYRWGVPRKRTLQNREGGAHGPATEPIS